MVLHHIRRELEKDREIISRITETTERWIANFAFDIAKAAASRHEYGWQLKEWYKKDEVEAMRLREAIDVLKTGSDAAKEFANRLEWCVTHATNFFNED